jgi:hypothetical protein
MKIVALDKIYNFLVFNFSFEVIKMFKKLNMSSSRLLRVLVFRIPRFSPLKTVPSKTA